MPDASLCSDFSVVPFGRLSPRSPDLLLTIDGDVVGPKGIRKTHPGTGGYLRVSYQRADGTRGRAPVHVLVCETFHGPRPAGLVTRHRNGNNQDNRPSNLCWGTLRENYDDSVEHGTAVRGEKHRGAKLTDAQVHEIRSLVEQGALQRDVADRFGVSQNTVSKVIRRTGWAHVAEEVK